MFDEYKNACAQLTLGQDKIEEMITMTENKPKKRLSRPIKTILIAAACVAALTVTAFAAPAVQQLFTTYTITYRSSNGSADFTVPTLKLEERDGRSILTVDGLETDVTDAFAKNGQYEMNVDGANIVVKPDGWVEITMAEDEERGPITYTFNLQADPSVTIAGTITADGEALAEDEMGSYQITTDENGEVVVVESKPLYLPE